MENPASLVILGAFAALLSWIGVRLIRPYAAQRQKPDDRNSPAQIAPRGGGLAILVVVLLIFMPIGLSLVDPGQVVRFALAGAMIAVIGFFDDLRALPRLIRLLVQSLAAMIFIPAAPIQVINLAHSEFALPDMISYLISIVWIVGLVNVYSYMDGINGLASGQAVLAGGLWAGVGLISDRPAVTLLALLIAGASLGFLVYNLPPNSIFLGDVGSNFLGFSLAALPMMIVAQGESPRLIISGGLIMSLFVFDAALTFARYLFKGGESRRANRSHLYQRLVQLGDPPFRVTLLYLTLSTGFGLAGLIYWREATVAALVVVAMVCLTLYAWIAGRESAREQDKQDNLGPRSTLDQVRDTPTTLRR